MSEDRLIRWIGRLAGRGSGLVRKGIGDDAAVVRSPGRSDCILTADMFVEGTHFDAGSRPVLWGRKAVMANISDIAAMGGVPEHCLVSLGLPRRRGFVLGRRIMRGVLDACKEYRVDVVGGDITRSRDAVISVVMTGRVAPGRAVTRGGARPGDRIFTTGPFGGSLQSGRHLRFRPRLPESVFLAKKYRPSAMIDSSDGPAKELRLLGEAGGVGMRIRESRVPMNKGVRSLEEAMTAGEDFELLFTLRPKQAASLRRDKVAARSGFTFFEIGVVVPKKEGFRIIGTDGKIRHFPRGIDHHFGIEGTRRSV